MRRTRARAVAARRARDGIDVANTLFALEVIARASRGSETRPGRPSRRWARRSARARSTNPKHALASRPSPPRSLERARRGDGAGMAISETGDVRVPSYVTLTTTSRAAPARRIEGHRTARPAYLGIIIRSRPNANSHKERLYLNLDSVTDSLSRCFGNQIVHDLSRPHRHDPSFVRSQGSPSKLVEVSLKAPSLATFQNHVSRWLSSGSAKRSRRNERISHPLSTTKKDFCLPVDTRDGGSSTPHQRPVRRGDGRCGRRSFRQNRPAERDRCVPGGGSNRGRVLRDGRLWCRGNPRDAILGRLGNHKHGGFV